MNDNTTTDVTMYFFELVASNKGIAPSQYSREETLERLHKDLADFYGEDGYELREFREATEEELQIFASLMSDLAAEDLDTDVTIN